MFGKEKEVADETTPTPPLSSLPTKMDVLATGLPRMWNCLLQGRS
jgi:hypothetical protein